MFAKPSGSWPCDQSAAHRIAMIGYDDWNRPGDMLGGVRHQRTRCYDDIDIEAYQVGRKFRKLVQFSFGGISVFDDEISTLDVTQFPQSLQQGVSEPLRSDVWRSGAE